MFIPRWNLEVLHVLYLEENYKTVCDTLLQHLSRIFYFGVRDVNVPLILNNTYIDINVYMVNCIYMLYTETCSKLKHQPNTDIPHKNGTCITKYL